MTLNKLLIASSIAFAFAAPTSSQAATSSLDGWGSAFAAAHAASQQGGLTASGQGHGELHLALGSAPAAQPTPAAPATPAPSAPVAQQPAPTAPDAPAAQPAPPADNGTAMNDQPATPDTGAQAAEAPAAPAQGNSAMASVSGSLGVSVTPNGDAIGQTLGKVDAVYQAGGNAVASLAKNTLGTVQSLADQTSGTQNVALQAAQSSSINAANLATVNLESSLAATASLANAGQLAALTAMTSSIVQNAIAARPASLLGLLH